MQREYHYKNNHKSLTIIQLQKEKIEMENIKYQLIDTYNKQVLGTYKNRKLARNKADKLDNQYGAIRYIIKLIKE